MKNIIIPILILLCIPSLNAKNLQWKKSSNEYILTKGKEVIWRKSKNSKSFIYPSNSNTDLYDSANLVFSTSKIVGGEDIAVAIFSVKYPDSIMETLGRASLGNPHPVIPKTEPALQTTLSDWQVKFHKWHTKNSKNLFFRAFRKTKKGTWEVYSSLYLTSVWYDLCKASLKEVKIESLNKYDFVFAQTPVIKVITASHVILPDPADLKEFIDYQSIVLYTPKECTRSIQINDNLMSFKQANSTYKIKKYALYWNKFDQFDKSENSYVKTRELQKNQPHDLEVETELYTGISSDTMQCSFDLRNKEKYTKDDFIKICLAEFGKGSENSPAFKKRLELFLSKESSYAPSTFFNNLEEYQQFLKSWVNKYKRD